MTKQILLTIAALGCFALAACGDDGGGNNPIPDLSTITPGNGDMAVPPTGCQAPGPETCVSKTPASNSDYLNQCDPSDVAIVKVTPKTTYPAPYVSNNCALPAIP